MNSFFKFLKTLRIFCDGVMFRGRYSKFLFGKSSLSVTGKGNTIVFKSDRIGRIYIYMYGNNCTLEIEEGAIIKECTFHFEDDNCIIHVGKNTTIEKAHLSAAENNSMIQIGEDCMISTDVRISTTDSHSVIDIETGNRINQAGNVEIGNHVWIGANVTINKNVQVLDGSILAGHSVVTHNVDKNCIAAGMPAIVVKRGVSWNRKRI